MRAPPSSLEKSESLEEEEEPEESEEDDSPISPGGWYMQQTAVLIHQRPEFQRPLHIMKSPVPLLPFFAIRTCSLEFLSHHATFNNPTQSARNRIARNQAKEEEI